MIEELFEMYRNARTEAKDRPNKNDFSGYSQAVVFEFEDLLADQK